MIHRFRLNGYNIVLDVNSGGVHLVDDLIYDLLDAYHPGEDINIQSDNIKQLIEVYGEDSIKEAVFEIQQLYEEGMLYSSDEYEQFSDQMVSSPIKAMCLHISHDCNLRCEYCFASTGDFGEGRKMMSVDTGKKAIDFLLEHSKGRRNLELDFFGGEPLMNFKAVKAIVQYAREREVEYNKNFRFTITTNGVLLTPEKIDYINREMSNVVLSLDGRQSVNDNVRQCVDGSGSYTAIVDNYKALVDKRGDKEYYVRGTFTKYNLDFVKDVLHLAELGFDQVSVEPVVAGAEKEYSLTEKELPQIYDEYEKLSRLLIKRKKEGTGINFFHFALDLNQGPCAIKRLRGCGCGNEYVAITPDGDIYPCHQFVGMEEWKMGNLEEQTLDLDKKNYFAQTTVYHKEDCKKCWAKFYCSGGCNANNYQYQGDILKPHSMSCEMEKKRLECAIMMKAALMEEC